MSGRFHSWLPAVFAAFFLLVVSCDREEDSILPDVSPREDSLRAAKGSVFVSVTSDGPWTLDVTFDDAEPWAYVSPSSGTGSVGNVLLSYKANEDYESRSLTLVLHTPAGTASSVVVQAGLEAPDPEAVAVHWLELPAMPGDDGLTAYTHDMLGGQYIDRKTSGVRNWTCYWDASEHLSLWVAYPLNNALRGTGSRSNDWSHFDPLVPQEEQPDLRLGSYGGGWTRGHQIPSADRLSPYSANVSTFYPTNMTPQQWDFNGDIWADLEGRVRDYASRADTLYVVTGCLYKDSTVKTYAYSGFRVKVPTHYFKALLYRGSSSSQTVADGFMAAGYMLPHTESIAEGNYIDYIMSIDKLESETGIDFFPNLIQLIGEDKAALVEATEPSKWWK